MDLQLNISSVDRKPKKTIPGGNNNKNVKNKPASGTSSYSFVNKPAFVGKTIARKRTPQANTAKGSQFSLLNTKNEPQDVALKTIVKESLPQFSKNTEYNKKDNFTPEAPKSTHITEDNVVSFDITEENRRLRKENYQKYERSKKPFKHNNKTDSFRKNDKHTSEINDGKIKKSPYAQVSALFRNNPEIPKIGQRHVKPINEKVFSGKNFEDLNIHSFTISNLEKNLGLKQLTVVQQKATPVILKGRDVLVRSQTGSGKTLAYALPIVEALQAIRPKINRQDGLKALVVVPTRELALQTYELFVKLVYPFTWIVPGYLIGGESRKAEKNRIRKGFNILIGTPGRICDHLQHTASLKFNSTRCLVLDEADRLLDMGYERDVSSIVQALESHKAASGYDPMAIIRKTMDRSHVRFDGEEQSKEDVKKTPKDMSPEKIEAQHLHEMTNVFQSQRRQTVLLSATLTKAVETLAGLTMEDPVFIDSSDGRSTVIADSIAKPVKEEDEIKIKVEEEQNETDNELEIVPQEESDNENKSTNEDDSESNESDDDGSEEDEEESDDSDSSDKEDEKIAAKTSGNPYKGLKAFGGITSPKKSKSSPTKTEKLSPKKEENPKKKKSKKQTIEGSDSDSDYDYFVATKNDPKVQVPTAPTDTDFITEVGTHSNPFQNAVSQAIAQDEMVIPASVTQIYIVTPMKLRLVTLSALIIERCVKKGSGKMLIFMGTQDLIDYHCELLSRVLTGKAPKKMKSEEKSDPKNIVKKQKKDANMSVDDESHQGLGAYDDEDKKNQNESGNENSDEEISVPKVQVKTPKKEKRKKVGKFLKALEMAKMKEEAVDEKVESGDEYQYEYDGMSLVKYEEKVRTDKAFVNVEFFQLHGSMDQKTRTEVFKTFRQAKSGVLLCTDVAARGLDLPHVDCIVQYTGPISATDYVHRVGRTARAGNVGTAIMMLLPSEILFVRQLEERRIRLHQEEMETSLSSLGGGARAPKGGLDPNQAAAAALQQTFEELVAADNQLHLKGCKAFTSWLRFYSTYPREARAAFDRNALHAGHAARALALRDTPKMIASQVPRNEPAPNEKRKESDMKKKRPEKMPAGFDSRPTSFKSAKRDREMMVGEFESGMGPLKKKKKKT